MKQIKKEHNNTAHVLRSWPSATLWLFESFINTRSSPTSFVFIFSYDDDFQKKKKTKKKSWADAVSCVYYGWQNGDQLVRR